jgi:hypothetical protein
MTISWLLTATDTGWNTLGYSDYSEYLEYGNSSPRSQKNIQFQTAMIMEILTRLWPKEQVFGKPVEG